MTGVLDFIKRNRKTIAVCAVVIVLFIPAFLAFKVLVKAGSPKYIYNYMHEAKGSMEVSIYPEANLSSAENEPYAVDATSPSGHGVKESIRVNGEITDTYNRIDRIDFDRDMDLTDISPDSLAVSVLMRDDAVATFRGNYRRSLTAANAELGKALFSKDKWVYATGRILKSNGVDYWSGNGWTGQPLVATWTANQRKSMNLYAAAKEKASLSEVIYPGMDGSIHFLDLETGEETRPSIYVGMTFKGTATLYPGNVPLLVCGSGDAQPGPFGETVSQRFYIFSLIDGKLLWEGGMEDEFAPRTWHAYDSSAVIDPYTDTLIQPGENGVIYTMKLNTVYNPTEGSISISPTDFVDYTFTIEDKYSQNGYLWGSECSAAVWEGYVYLADNAGTIYCLDINTMKMIWINEVNEDINSSPIFELDGKNKYLYVATTLKYNYDAHSMGKAAIYKLNAITGEVIWEKPYEVQTVKGHAGGVLSTGILGQGEMSDYIFYSVSKTPGVEDGYLVALNKYTGQERWSLELPMYSWSSTAAVVSQNGDGYLIQGCQNGDLLMVDAKTGVVKDKINFGSGIEATPVVYKNRIVLATRSEKIIGISLE